MRNWIAFLKSETLLSIQFKEPKSGASDWGSVVLYLTDSQYKYLILLETLYSPGIFIG